MAFTLRKGVRSRASLTVPSGQEHRRRRSGLSGCGVTLRYVCCVCVYVVYGKCNDAHLAEHRVGLVGVGSVLVAALHLSH